MSSYQVEERAGGLVFRQNGPRVEYLLVTSNSNKNRWIFPAGHVEPGETAAAAALREVAEEAGVLAELIGKLGDFQYHWNHYGTQTLIITSLFLMEYRLTVALEPEGRRVAFFEYGELLKVNLWEESRRFLQQAQQMTTALIRSRHSAPESFPNTPEP